MGAIAVLEFKKNIKDKGIWFWTFILPIVFIIGFVTIFGGMEQSDPEELIVQIVPGYTVMFSFYIMISIVVAFVKERNGGMVARVASTPLPKLQYFLGKWIPFIVLVLLQIVVLFSFGVAVYDLPLGDPLALIVLSISLALISTGCGLAMAVLVKTENMGIGLTQVIALGGALLGGLWMPIEFMPEAIQGMAQFLPQHWALKGYKTIILDGGNLLDIWASILVLLGYAIVSIAVAMAAYPRFLRQARS
ncbi:ABC transporter permease [Rossellomorea marisflavi]|uniref:ABC transporter permease n=1 Tax=Rossellomorea marisflavi TaxID=189381 RepID=UPI0011509850|nr:ABC transporter permease [Rossellomorea marisflavi]USK93084.1 ABC transporter permease [Rossellomorea marisflavi]